MLRKRSRGEQSELYHPDEGTPLVLQAGELPGIYHFPSDVVQAHRHMISRLMRDQGMPKRLSIVSALRGEGVTFSSLALATTLGNDFPTRVCYVDLNWWWPAPQLLKLNQSNPGIAGILKNEVTPEEVLVKTEYPNLYLLPAGQVPPEQRPIVARSTALKDLLTLVRDDFDTLVLDIPAILATSDAIVLAALGDACVIVVRQGVTATGSIKLALDDIANMEITGVLLNRVKVATPAWIRSWMPEL